MAFVVGALLLASAAYLQPAQAANPLIKNFSVFVTPPSVEAGSTYAYSFTITNRGPNPQTIGSANFSLPSGFRLRQGTGYDAPTLSAPGTILPTANGDTLLQLRNMAVPSTGANSITVTFSAEAPCAAAGSPFAWTAAVKQSNDFSGPPGNDFTLVDGQATTAVTGSCRLEILTNSSTGLQVASAQVNSTITTEPYVTSGIPVKVRVESGTPTTQTVTFSVASIRLTPEGVVNGGSLGADTSSAGSDSPGVAAYTSNLFAIDTKGAGYVLRATTSEPGVDASTTTGPVSNAFNVDTSVVHCSGPPCHLPKTTSGGTAYELTAFSGGTLAASLSVQDFADPGNTCPGSTYVLPTESEPVTFNLVGGNGSKQLLYTILFPLRAASKYQPCYARPVANGVFATATGTSLALKNGYYVGLLPLCKNAPAPCYQGYTVDKSKAVTLIVNSPRGDPWTH